MRHDRRITIMPQGADAPQPADELATTPATLEPPRTLIGARPPRGVPRQTKRKPGQRGNLLTFTPEVAARICALISSGLSLRKSCDRLDLAASTVNLWVINDHEGFAAQYARARESQFQIWADEIVDLADDVQPGIKLIEERDANGKLLKRKRITDDCVERTRLRIEARKWLLSKLKHKTYGDRLDVTGSDGGTVNVYLVRGETIEEKRVEPIQVEAQRLQA
jgi:hypothetical protein